MATLLETAHLAKHYTNEAVIEGVSFKLNQGENGCGKSTLLKLIAGVEVPTGGHIACPRDTRIGYLAQALDFTEGNDVYQELLGVFADVRALGQRLEEMQTGMADPSLDAAAQQRLLDQYGPLADAFERDGGYTYLHRIDTVSEGLGLAAKRQRPVAVLSGGEKNVLALARLLLQEPNILLLDEPANHLDFKGLEWLETFLLQSPCAVLLVSHNRYLLDRVTTRTLEIEAGHLTDYVGSYSAYRQEKQRRLLRQQEEYQAQQKEIRRLEAMIKRFERWEQMSDDPRIATRRRNKERTIERMEKIERPELKKQSITPRFAADSKGGRIALELKGYTRQISGKELFADVDLHIGYGERVGLLGANGSGKSTLFRDIVDHGAWDHTRIRLGPQVRLGYYSQEHETLDMERSIVEEMRQQPGLSKEGAFHILMNFMFSYLDMDQPVGTLSGGQKSRLQLAKLMAAEVNFLLLDEPTNHLDTYSQERVEEALEAFAGTILVISHDRYFLDRIVERIVEVETPTLRDHPGNFTQYWRRKTVVEPRPEEKRHNLNKASVAKVRTAPSPSQTDGQARRQVEAQLEMLEEEKEEITTALAAAYEAEEYDLAEELGRDLCPLEEEIDRLYTVWETLVAQLDGVE